MADPDPPPLAPGTVVGRRYRVVAELGQGGFGRVYTADDLELNRRVALKVADADNYDRVSREARWAARLQSKHAVRILDVGEVGDGLPYLVMEHLTGRSLQQVLATEGSVAVELAVSWIQQACEALAEAHALGIVHRDIKPSNLFLHQTNGGSPCLKLLDFGLAKPFSEVTDDLTETGLLIGSPAYMSPEQVRGGPLDPRTDIWSLGVVLFELLSGARPFSGQSNAATLASIAADPPLQLRGPNLSQPLIRIVAQCLRKSPHERTLTAAQLSRLLASPLIGTSGSIRTESEGETAQVLFNDIPLPTRQSVGWRWTRVSSALIGSALIGSALTGSGIVGLGAAATVAHHTDAKHLRGSLEGSFPARGSAVAREDASCISSQESPPLSARPRWGVDAANSQGPWPQAETSLGSKTFGSEHPRGALESAATQARVAHQAPEREARATIPAPMRHNQESASAPVAPPVRTVPPSTSGPVPPNPELFTAPDF